MARPRKPAAASPSFEIPSDMNSEPTTPLPARGPKQTPGAPKKAPRKLLRDNIQGITKPAIQRLAHMAGVVEMSGDIYEEVRLRIKALMDHVIADAVAMAEHSRRKRISADDISEAVRTVKAKGEPFLHNVLRSGAESELKRCPVYESKEAVKTTSGLRRVKFYQKQKDCVHISRSGFARLASEVGQDYKTDFQFSSNALGLMQLVVEDYVVKVLAAAQHAAIHASRKTLQAKDIQVVERITHMT
jgi:histone H3/H4